MQTAISFLPVTIAENLARIPLTELDLTEEIRLRIGRPIELMINGEPKFIPYLFSPDDAVSLMNKISQHSLYTLEEELRRGYITVCGGHRIGLSGKVVLESGKVKAIRDIASFNIRIAREKLGSADNLVPFLYEKGWLHTMIIGPPQTGKTTLLRDIARYVSSENDIHGTAGSKVGIVDERSEIAGCVNGIPQLTFGHRVDVLDACPKAEGMMMLIRSMSPEVMIVDEIGRIEDSEAIMEAVNAGITLIMTTHGHSFEDVKNRPVLKEIIQNGFFQRYIELSRKEGPGTISNILDGKGKPIQSKVRVT